MAAMKKLLHVNKLVLPHKVTCPGGTLEEDTLQ